MREKKTLLDIEIENIEDRLYKFAQSPVWDSGVRWPEKEGYLKGLKRARFLVRKQAKLLLKGASR